jgi:hypothetical protein
MNKMPGWDKCGSIRKVGSYGKQRAWVKVGNPPELDMTDPMNW